VEVAAKIAPTELDAVPAAFANRSGRALAEAAVVSPSPTVVRVNFG
jgi:hypothetical protein